MKKFKRIFLIVADSAGIGYEPDAFKWGDEGANTWVHISERKGGLKCPNLEKMGLGQLDDILGVSNVANHPNSFVCRLNEASNGKDTMTGHWEMVGIKTNEPFITFTETGFPDELIEELERKTGHRIIGNYSSSGTEILKVLGEEQKRDNSLIVYTSADSVLQIAAHEETTGLEELYRCCHIARDLCMKPEWLVGRIIARPFIGDDKDNFKRTPNRHDYTVSPSGITVLDILNENGYTVSAVGKINDIFNGVGINKTVSTKSNMDGMDKTIEYVKNDDFEGLCFVNLVEFDSEFGHRRNPIGYGDALESFDKRIGEMVEFMKDDDLLMITADHGNDPTWKGTDHTREKVPLIIYSPSIKNGRYLDERTTFGDIGASILFNFGLNKHKTMIGEPIKEIFE